MIYMYDCTEREAQPNAMIAAEKRSCIKNLNVLRQQIFFSRLNLVVHAGIINGMHDLIFFTDIVRAVKFIRTVFKKVRLSEVSASCLFQFKMAMCYVEYTLFLMCDCNQPTALIERIPGSYRGKEEYLDIATSDARNLNAIDIPFRSIYRSSWACCRKQLLSSVLGENTDFELFYHDNMQCFMQIVLKTVLVCIKSDTTLYRMLREREIGGQFRSGFVRSGFWAVMIQNRGLDEAGGGCVSSFS